MARRLLLADDSTTIRRVVELSLGNEPYEITAVDSGDACLSKARELKPDVIVADCSMERSGYEVAEQLQADPSLKGTPLVLLSSAQESFDEARARQAGVEVWLQKPFDSQALIEKLAGLFGEKPQPQAEPARPAAAAPRPLPTGQPLTMNPPWPGFQKAGAAPAPAGPAASAPPTAAPARPAPTTPPSSAAPAPTARPAPAAPPPGPGSAPAGGGLASQPPPWLRPSAPPPWARDTQRAAPAPEAPAKAPAPPPPASAAPPPAAAAGATPSFRDPFAPPPRAAEPPRPPAWMEKPDPTTPGAPPPVPSAPPSAARPETAAPKKAPTPIEDLLRKPEPPPAKAPAAEKPEPIKPAPIKPAPIKPEPAKPEPAKPTPTPKFEAPPPAAKPATPRLEAVVEIEPPPAKEAAPAAAAPSPTAIGDYLRDHPQALRDAVAKALTEGTALSSQGPALEEAVATYLRANPDVLRDALAAHLRERAAQIEEIVRKEIREQKKAVETVAWEVIPDLAESLIRQEIDRILREKAS